MSVSVSVSVSALAETPPDHEFEAGAIGVGPRHPTGDPFEARLEAFDDFLLGAAERRTVDVADHVVDGEEIAAGPKAAGDGFRIQVAVGGWNRAEEGVLEDPVEGPAGGVAEKIPGLEGAVQARGRGEFGGELDRGRREVESGRGEAVTGPGPGVMAEAAPRDEHRAAGKIGAVPEKIGESGRAFALVPGGVARLIAILPVRAGHVHAGRRVRGNGG